MIATLKADVKLLKVGLKGQDGIFYTGLIFIILYYMRPQYIFPQLLIVPWFKITIGIGLVMLLSKGRLEFKKEHFWLLLFAFLAWLSAQASMYPEVSDENISAPFIFFLEVLFLSNCAKNAHQLKLLLIVFFICIFKMSFFGARVWVSRGFGFSDWGIQGPTGYFENSGEYSLLMAMSGVMSIPVIVALKPKTKLYWILPITAIMAVIAASSRGGQLALFVGIVYLLVTYKRIRFKDVLYITVIGAMVWAVFPEEQKARFVSAGDDQTSTNRLSYWSAGIDMAMENPILGIGYDAFPEHYHRYYKVNDGSYLMQRREVSHNSLVQVASTIGVPAMLIYIGLHFYVYGRKNCANKYKTDKGYDLFLQHFQVALRAGIITYFVGAFFMSVVFYPYIYLLLSFSIINKRLRALMHGEKAMRDRNLDRP